MAATQFNLSFTVFISLKSLLNFCLPRRNPCAVGVRRLRMASRLDSQRVQCAV
jgi:hypothetical protein